MTALRSPEAVPEGNVGGLCARLTDGEVLLLPTDTVYGLCCDPSNQAAVDRIYRIKGRNRGVPLAVLVSGREQAETLVAPDARLAAMDTGAWPSTLTVVMPRRSEAAELAIGVGNTKIGIRCPSRGLIATVVAEFGPLVSTSANRHGHRPGGEVVSILGDLQSDDPTTGIDGFVEGGRLDGGASTVVDAIKGGWIMLRTGPVDATRISEVLGSRVASQ